jgi:hypothetical protein
LLDFTVSWLVIWDLSMLIECSKDKQQSIIQFLWSVNVKTRDMYERITVQFNGNCIIQRKV